MPNDNIETGEWTVVSVNGWHTLLRVKHVLFQTKNEGYLKDLCEIKDTHNASLRVSHGEAATTAPLSPKTGATDCKQEQEWTIKTVRDLLKVGTQVSTGHKAVADAHNASLKKERELKAHLQEIAKAHGFDSVTAAFVEIDKLRTQLKDAALAKIGGK